MGRMANGAGNDDPNIGAAAAFVGMEPAGSGLPPKRIVGKTVVRGKGDCRENILQMAAKSIFGHGGAAKGTVGGGNGIRDKVFC